MEAPLTYVKSLCPTESDMRLQTTTRNYVSGCLERTAVIAFPQFADSV
jgi:hypothetical protein